MNLKDNRKLWESRVKEYRESDIVLCNLHLVEIDSV